MTNKILKITSIAVLTTFIMTMAMTNVAQADDPPEEKTEDFKCDESHGSFYDPFLETTNPFDSDAAFAVVVAGSWATNRRSVELFR